MSTLYNPTKQDRSSLASGARKLRIRRLKQDNKIMEGKCLFCEKDVYLFCGNDKMLTISGSGHSCKGIRENKLEK